MRVLIFGDSITQGFWGSEGGWANRLRKAYDQKNIEAGNYDQPTIFNLGISGDTSKEILQRVENETKARLWPGQEIVFAFSIGVNDARLDGNKPFSAVEEYVGRLNKIVEIAKTFSSKIMFVGLTRL